MPASAKILQDNPDTVVRTVRLRLIPGTKTRAHQLAGTAGACRFVWNHFLARQQQAYGCWRDYRAPRPSVSFFSMGKEFTALRGTDEYAWRQAYGFGAVRHTLKDLADAYTAFLQGTTQYPRFKSKYRATDGFTIPQGINITPGPLHVPRIGKLRLKGAEPYAGCTPRQVRVRQEGTASRPRWYAYVVYEVPASRVKPPCETGMLGLDGNVGQVTDSDGNLYRKSDQAALDAKIQRKQRHLARKRRGSIRYRRMGGQLTRLRRKSKHIRAHDAHHISRALADKAHTVVIEDLHTRGMTTSARGTVDTPGTNVMAKSGLNRRILATSWGHLEQRLAYKCGRIVKVQARHTSQTCHRCGYVHRHNRKSQAGFECLACGTTMNADHNSALNILVRHCRPVARGTGATAQREAFPLGTSLTRDHDIPEALCYLGL